jgi:hypothetical protein
MPLLREPELLLRRLSHRVALIPAYAKYVVLELQQSAFDAMTVGNFRYPAGIRYRPEIVSSKPIDEIWQKICVTFSFTKSLADGSRVVESHEPIDAADRTPVQKEVKVFYAALQEMDERLQDATLSEEEQATREADLQQLLRRAYLLMVCTLLVFRVRNISAEIVK